MEVILLEQIEKLGNVGELVKVRDGFARNFLLPQKKALRATEENRAYFEERKAQIQQENEAKRAEAAEEAKKVDGIFIALIQQAGEDGRLFGSVRRRDITAQIAEQTGDAQLDKSAVILTTPIKTLGIHQISLKLHAEVKASVYVNVARSKDEAEEAKKELLSSKKNKKKDQAEKVEAVEAAPAEAEAPVDLAEVAPEGNA